MGKDADAKTVATRDGAHECAVMVAGERVSVHRFTEEECHVAESLINPMLDDLRQWFIRGKDGKSTYQQLAVVFSKHPDAYLELISLSCSRPRKWLESLPDRDGRLIGMKFWTLNARFITRQIQKADVNESLKSRESEVQFIDGAGILRA